MRHFQQEHRLQSLVSPISDKTNLVSKGFEKVQKNRSPISTPTDKFGRSGKRHRRESKTKESRHYQESDILESPTVYYRSNIADKQSDYEDIWGTETLSTFKPVKSPEVENWKAEDKPEFKRTPDLLEKLEKLEKTSPLSPLFDDRKDRNRLNRSLNKQSTFQSHIKGFVMDLEQEPDQKQNSPFYAEPADAIIVRRKVKPAFVKTRHSDPALFNNWQSNNPYLSGGNILERIDSVNDINEEQFHKNKASLSVDNIVDLNSKETESKLRGFQKGKSIMKGKPVQPPKVALRAVGKTDQSWAVDSSWEFIGNEDSEGKEGERKFPSIEQQMDSEDAGKVCTVQQIIAQR